MAKKALGKGLGALIKKQDNNLHKPAPSNKSSTPIDTQNEVLRVPIDRVVPSPLQPRKHFTEGNIDELLESIRQHGVIQPLIAREVDGKLELIAGERRWRASSKLGLPEVPVIVREASDRDVLEMALIENLQREDLNPIEEAAGYVRLAKEFSMKQGSIAETVGKSRAAVANAMRLLDLHTDVQELVAHGRLTVGHAKAVLSLRDQQLQLQAADQVIRKKLTVRATEKLVQSLNNPKTVPDKDSSPEADSSKADVDALIQKLQDKLQADFSARVQIQHGPKKGKIEIPYSGNKDLNRILELLGVSLGDI